MQRSLLTLFMADCDVEGESSVASTAGSGAAAASSRRREFEAIVRLGILFAAFCWLEDISKLSSLARRSSW